MNGITETSRYLKNEVQAMFGEMQSICMTESDRIDDTPEALNTFEARMCAENLIGKAKAIIDLIESAYHA